MALTTGTSRMTSHDGSQHRGAEGPYDDRSGGQYSGPYGDPSGGQYNAPYGGQPPASQGMPYGRPMYQAPPPPTAYPGPYGAQYGYGYPYVAPQRTNGLAIASMVLGILWLYWIGSVLALVFGYIARNQIRERGEAGNGMAVAGIVLGWIGVGVLGITFLVAIASGV